MKGSVKYDSDAISGWRWAIIVIRSTTTANSSNKCCFTPTWQHFCQYFLHGVYTVVAECENRKILLTQERFKQIRIEK
jgi:hypothetical protein